MLRLISAFAMLAGSVSLAVPAFADAPVTSTERLERLDFDIAILELFTTEQPADSQEPVSEAGNFDSRRGASKHIAIQAYSIDRIRVRDEVGWYINRT